VDSPRVIDTADGAVIDVRVVPRAGRSAVAGVRDNALLVRLASAPVDGAANDDLIATLARTLDRPRRDIRILAGDRSRSKRVLVVGMTRAAVLARLNN
jgi:uncharacterized protein (TIGR00251 family)